MHFLQWIYHMRSTHMYIYISKNSKSTSLDGEVGHVAICFSHLISLQEAYFGFYTHGYYMQLPWKQACIGSLCGKDWSQLSGKQHDINVPISFCFTAENDLLFLWQHEGFCRAQSWTVRHPTERKRDIFGQALSSNGVMLMWNHLVSSHLYLHHPCFSTTSRCPPLTFSSLLPF